MTTKTLIVAIFACLLIGCAGMSQRSEKNFSVRDDDFDLIAEASLKFIERSNPVTTIVVPENADARARTALARLRTVISPGQIPQSSIFKLPDGYFVLQTFQIEDGVAMFEGQMGPVRIVPVAPSTDDCGTNFSIPFGLESGDWASHTFKKSVCWPKRVWWPVAE